MAFSPTLSGRPGCFYGTARLSLGHRVVVVANHPRYLPRAVFVLPQMDELRFAHGLGVLMPRVVEAVHTHFHRAVALMSRTLLRFSDICGRPTSLRI